MAYQPKSYRKFLVTGVAAAMVATVAAPIAPSSVEAASNFNDISGVQSWAGDAINYLVGKGAVQGYPDGTFKPYQALTRGEAAKVLAVSLGLNVDMNAKTNFADTANHWSSPYVKALQEQAPNAIDGFPDGSFKPNATISRQELAKIVVEAYELEGNSAVVVSFNDVTGWASDYIYTLASLGIVEGIAPGTFDRQGNVTRAQAAVFVHRAEVEGARVVPVVIDNDISANVKAINNTTVEVHFGEEYHVYDAQALDFSIAGLDVTNAAVKQTDSSVVVLTTSPQTGGTVYTVTSDGATIGSFEGISAIIPTKIELNTDSVQGIVGQQVTLKADIGQTTAGVPVTFNVKADNQSLNKDQVEEVYTDANGVATLTYTQYNAGFADEVAVYPTGAPQVRDFATIHWGVTTILSIVEDDTRGDVLNNGENKVYKVTYLNSKTGKPVENAYVNITFAENIDVPVNKITHATANGKTPYQLTDGKVESVQVRTDSKGEATVTISGTNTKATPIAFLDGSGSYSVSNWNEKLDRTELQVHANELTFGAVHSKYEIEVTRDGGEEAAVGTDNGRKYMVSVKDENGKAASGEVVNVAFNEVLDRVISTNTKATFVVNNTDLKGTTSITAGSKYQQITLTLDSKGEGEFKIVSSDNKDYATPVVWIDINTSSNNDGSLEEGEPNKVALMTYFADEKIQGSKLKVYNNTTGVEIKDNRAVEGNHAVEFRFNVANQSGENFLGSIYDFKGTYQVTNTGTKDVYVWTKFADIGDLTKATVISTRRGETFTLPTLETGSQVSLYVYSSGESASVDVTAYGEAATGYYYESEVVRLAESKVAKATFKSTQEIGNSYKGTVSAFDKDKKKITFAGKKELDYKTASDDNKVRYFDQRTGNIEIANTQFEDFIVANLGSNEVQYFKNSNGDITFTILSTTGTGSQPTVDQVAANQVTTEIAALTNVTLADEAKVVAARAAYNALTPAQQALVSATSVEKLETAEKVIIALKDDQTVEVTFSDVTAEAITLNSINKFIGLYESIDVAGTIATGEVSEVELTFTDGGDAADTTVTVEVVDGTFFYSLSNPETYGSVIIEAGTKTEKFTVIER